MLKHLQFKDNESNTTESQALKRSHVDINDNKERQSLDKYQGKNSRFILLFLLS